MKSLPPVVIEALYYYFREEKLSWPGFGNDYQTEQIKTAIEQDFLVDFEDGIEVVEEDPKISAAIKALNELQSFMWRMS